MPSKSLVTLAMRAENIYVYIRAASSCLEAPCLLPFPYFFFSISSPPSFLSPFLSSLPFLYSIALASAAISMERRNDACVSLLKISWVRILAQVRCSSDENS